MEGGWRVLLAAPADAVGAERAVEDARVARAVPAVARPAASFAVEAALEYCRLAASLGADGGGARLLLVEEGGVVREVEGARARDELAARPWRPSAADDTPALLASLAPLAAVLCPAPRPGPGGAPWVEAGPGAKEALAAVARRQMDLCEVRVEGVPMKQERSAGADDYAVVLACARGSGAGRLPEALTLAWKELGEVPARVAAARRAVPLDSRSAPAASLVAFLLSDDAAAQAVLLGGGHALAGRGGRVFLLTLLGRGDAPAPRALKAPRGPRPCRDALREVVCGRGGASAARLELATRGRPPALPAADAPEQPCGLAWDASREAAYRATAALRAAVAADAPGAAEADEAVREAAEGLGPALPGSVAVRRAWSELREWTRAHADRSPGHLRVAAAVAELADHRGEDAIRADDAAAAAYRAAHDASERFRRQKRARDREEECPRPRPPPPPPAASGASLFDEYWAARRRGRGSLVPHAPPDDPPFRTARE